ncbi:MAG: AMIN domain-containing protein, partial [Gammaproteobacteria bacterium]
MHKARTGFAGALIAALMIAAAGQADAQSAAPSRLLTSIRTVTLTGGGVEVDLVLSQTASKPLSYSVNQPAAIVLDLEGTGLGLPNDERNQSVNAGVLTGIQTVAVNGRVRVLLNLGAMVPYQTRVQGDHIYVTVGAGGQTGGQGAVASTAPSAGTALAITDLQFHRTPDGAGRVSISLSSSAVSGSVVQEGKSVIVNFPGTVIPPQLQERLNVTDFATPVTTVTARQTPTGAQVVIEGTGEFEQQAFQANNHFAVDLRPVTPQQLAASGNRHYTGNKLTLNFQNIPVRAVLQILADFTDKNIVVSGSVSGNITLRLHDVPWDQALAIILKTQGLAMQQSGD